MNLHIIIWSVVSALAGFLFGFDTVVISGAERTIQDLWQLSPGLHGVALASALYGTVLGAMLGGWPTDRWGRKPTLISIGVLYFVSAVWSGLSTDVGSFIVARFIGGLGVGISTVAALVGARCSSSGRWATSSRSASAAGPLRTACRRLYRRACLASSRPMTSARGR